MKTPRPFSVVTNTYFTLCALFKMCATFENRLHGSGFITLLLAIGLVGSAPWCALSQTFNDAGFASELVATLPTYTPVGVAWAPDGRMFIWQKNGIVRVLKNGSLLATPFLDFSAKVNTYNDNGMFCLAFDPDF